MKILQLVKEKKSIMKKEEEAAEEHYREDHMSFWVSGGDGMEKKHSATMRVVPEKFLPPKERTEVLYFDFFSSVISLKTLYSKFGTGNSTMFENKPPNRNN
ncbi:hypothetical protein XENOCAPTIV_004113 [Xenoophorus captivus]|uniref:Uncharacterized protein n=2 Tax=Goodeidae TaxID=28758 RepID=A0ABV0QTY7_9TELE